MINYTCDVFNEIIEDGFNWKNYVGFQDLDVLGCRHIEYMVFDGDPIAFSIKWKFVENLEFIYTEDELNDIIQSVLLEFPDIGIKNDIEIQLDKIAVARKTRRGVANTNYKDVYFYMNQTAKNPHARRCDCPIIVAKYQNKYAVFKHPDFENYGFKVGVIQSFDNLADKK